MPELGRFFNVDPLADNITTTHPRHFSENEVTAHFRSLGGSVINKEPVDADAKACRYSGACR